MRLKSIFFITIITCLFLVNNNTFSQTIDELKITIKQLEAKNNSLEAKLKKCQKGKKNGGESERVQQLEEGKRQLQREIILLKGKEEKNQEAETELAKKRYWTSKILS